MFIRIFNSKSFILQFFLIAVVFVSAFYFPITIENNNGFNPLYGFILQLIDNSNYLSKILFIILIASPIFLTQYFATLFGLIPRNHFHFLFLAPLLIFTNPISWHITPLLIAQFFLVIGIANLFQLYGNENPIALSSTALIFSISSLFYTPFVWNIILLLIALIVFREFNLRELVMIFGSFILPYVYIFTWYFVDDNLINMWNRFVENLFLFSINISFDGSIVHYVFITFISMLSLYVFVSILSSLRNKLISIRAYLVFLIITFWFALIRAIFSGPEISSYYITLQFLIALFLSIYIDKKKKSWVFESIIFIIVLNYFYNLYLMYNA